MPGPDAATLHRDSIVIDAVCPLVSEDPQYLDWYREGGVTVVAPTVGGTDDARQTLKSLARWHKLLRERDDLLLVRSAADIDRAKREGRLGILFHFQGIEPIEAELDLVDLYKTIGVGVIQLAYNVRNRLGDGCEEASDAGLSAFGRALIARLNAARIVIDCSHTGARTSLEAIEQSAAPVILSHSNLASVRASPRNVADALARAIASSGGVIGVVGFPAMVAASSRPTLDDYVRHIDALVSLVGSDHVGLGLDYYAGQHGVASLEAATRNYETAVRLGLWSSAYPPPPHHYPDGIETPKRLPRLTEALLARGYGEADLRAILGGNWQRVFRTVWGA